MGEDLSIRLDSEEYVLRRGDGGLEVGRRVGGDVTWLDTVDLGLLPAGAREALERGDTSSPDLLTAVRGVVQAEVQRGA
jgi:hypothetical protein